MSIPRGIHVTEAKCVEVISGDTNAQVLEPTLALQVRHLSHVPVSGALRKVRFLKARAAVVQPAGARPRVVQRLRATVGVSQRQGRGEEEAQRGFELHSEAVGLEEKERKRWMGADSLRCCESGTADGAFFYGVKTCLFTGTVCGGRTEGCQYSYIPDNMTGTRGLADTKEKATSKGTMVQYRPWNHLFINELKGVVVTV